MVERFSRIALNPSTLHTVVRELKERFHSARRVMALTGAGVSTAAGIPDFRGPQGLYVTRRYDPETVFDFQAFCSDPRPFYSFARDFLETFSSVQPTLTHKVLAQCEKHELLQGLITQNIDGLHQKAGSRHVVEIHGGLNTAHCLMCGKMFSQAEIREDVMGGRVPRCSCGGLIKPDIVFFGENVRDWETAAAWAANADLMIVAGTSCSVFPAASLPALCSGDVFVINAGPVENLPFHARYVSAPVDEFFSILGREMGLDVMEGDNRQPVEKI